MPGMTVVVPCDGYETRLAVKAVLDHKGPCYVRTGRCALDTITDQAADYHFELGKGIRLRDGKDVTIIACGLMVQESVKAAELLAAEGIDARVIDMHTIKPVDRELILTAAEETGAVVTAEEHNIIGGLGGAVAEVLGTARPTPLEIVGVKDCFGHSGHPEELLHHFGLAPEDVAAAAKKAIARK